MQSQDLRRKFLSFFRDAGHEIVHSSSVIPHDDPSLLFINAGMNQFKQVFLGGAIMPYTKAATAQKCIRVGGKHNDLDNVGFTSRHLTFFEMLGNFSFGDYFKKDAIKYAWRLATEVFELDPKKIWVSVFQKDDEAFELWREWTDEKRIVRLGEKDNFWAMGDTGPCGPCSELLYDRGETFGSATSPLHDTEGERFFEFWNLVFMEFNRDQNGKMHPLPKQSIDTGMGLERMASLKMGAHTVFETDILRSLIAEVENISGKPYGSNPAYHVIADHIRSLCFAIADGAQPSNVERGYVLRKILRRAVRYGRTLDLYKPFLGKVATRLTHLMGEDFPELVEAKDKIQEILHLEEENFLRTLSRGGNILQNIIDDAKKTSTKQISGSDAFRLKDTYGFPLDELLLIAKDNELEVNLDTFQLLEEQAKERSRASQKELSQEAKANLFEDFVKKHGGSEFVGYDHLNTDGSIIGILRGDKFVESLDEGESGLVILDKTTFYAEMGGQVGDRGTLTHHDIIFDVEDTIQPFTGIIAHKGKVRQGTLLMGEPLHTNVDSQRRNAVRHNHTATHLLHYALTKVLGDHIRQAGSLVEEERLRFDFNHHKALSAEEIREVEQLINEKILQDTSVKTYQMDYEKIRGQSGVKQFFGEKYGKTVRIVDIGDYSKELCGGTHANSLASIGLFRILKEGSVASGVRRIEAVTGLHALKFVYDKENLLISIADELKTEPSKALGRIQTLLDEIKKQKEEMKKLRSFHLKSLVEEVLSKKQEVNFGTLIAYSSPDLDTEDLIQLGQLLIVKIDSGVVFLGAISADRIQTHIRLTPNLVAKGKKAADFVKAIGVHIEGSGGGKPDSAMAGGKNPSGFEKATAEIKHLLS